MRKTTLALFLLFITVQYIAAQQESFEFGKRMYRDGFYQEAILVFERITESRPTSPEGEESLFLLAEIHRKEERFREAEKFYQQFYERYPRSDLREDAFFYWSYSLYRQEKYSAAINLFGSFTETYPASTHEAVAIYYLLRCYEKTSSYQALITKGQHFIKTYPQDPRISDVIFMMGVSYLNLNRRNDADNMFELLLRDHPLSDARWEAVIVQNRLILEEQGETAALEYLTNLDLKTIPRQYEEVILKEIADLYITKDKYEKAAETLRMIIDKFDRSDGLAEYLYLYTISQLELIRYPQIIELFRQIDLRELSDSPFFIDYQLKVIETYYLTDRTEQASLIIDDLKEIIEEERHRYQLKYWQARLKERNGVYLEAINDYHDLISNYPQFVITEEILMRIGDIFFERLRLYQSAINYYSQIITDVGFKSDYHWKANYKKALCYTALNDYRAALNSLSQIDIETVTEETSKEEILKQIELLSRYKIVDTEQLSSKLIGSLFRYIETDDKAKLRNDLISVMLFDKKDTEGVLLLLENDQTGKGGYFRGKAYLKALQKADLENRSSERDRYLQKLEEEIAKLDEQLYPEWKDELEIERDYFLKGNSLSVEELIRLERFINQYPQAIAANRFRFMAGFHYLRSEVYAKADEMFSLVVKDQEIPGREYVNSMLEMAEYFFKNDQFGKAISYVERISDRININRPEELFLYAVALLNTDEKSKGLDKLKFLVKNAHFFPSRYKALELIADHYRQSGDHYEVIAYMLLYPENLRDRDYYLRLADDFLMTGNKNRAKESLMFIVEKDEEVLFKLAELHYETDDYLMAEITYNDIIRITSDKENRLTAKSHLAHLEFIKEDYGGSVTIYESLLQEIGERTDYDQYSFLDLKRLGKEMVISLFRVSNRPRADAVLKRFKTILETDPVVTAEIELHEAIYQMSINRSKAEKSFTSLTRNQQLPEKIRAEAYFWRGVNHLENKKTEEARKDFQEVLQAEDQHLRNQANLKLGTISFSKEQFQQALEHYYYVIQNDLKRNLAFDAAKNYAIVCKTIEEWQKAIEAYHIILERWGESGIEGETFFNIAYCQFRDRQYGEAVKSFEKAIPLLTDREMKAEAQYWIGESYFSLNQFDNAATEYLKVGYFYPEYDQWNAIAELKLAESYIRQGRIDNARSILENVIRKYGRDSDWGRQALIYLEQLRN
jgi:TolA-binding protein